MTQLHLTDSRTRQKRAFAPIDPGNVRVYVCGPTVYDRAHLGNARGAVAFDVLHRVLRHLYPGAVTFVRNVTDVDDKINARAAQAGRTIRDITEETLAWYRDDMATLGVLPPTHEPRATEYVPQMVAMIERLIAGGHAYAAEGHVLFDVRSDPAYGTFSNRALADMIAGARVEVAPYKRDPMDFVLWKPSDEDTPGWPSPWGRGRPGWHIECSAMSADLLGPDFDIHGGGSDLRFPHHENEVAQSRCACPEGGFARVWLHNEMLRVEGQKMSKSLGNFFSVRDLLDRGVAPAAIRLVFLSSRYSQPLDWTAAKVAEAEAALRKFRAAGAADPPGGEAETDLPPDPGVLAALCDDLNTPAALARLHELAALGQPVAAEAALMGISLDDRNYQEVEAIIAEILVDRFKARDSGNFAHADMIRDSLTSAGVEVRDRGQGTTGVSAGPRQIDNAAILQLARKLGLSV